LRGLALAVAVLAAAAGIAALAASGCATTEPPPARDERVVDFTPDGGWAKYIPATGPNYGPNPAAASSGGVAPQMNPVVPVFPAAWK
jgi:hypothetical protein